MSINIDPKLKPLYAKLLRLGIGNYLIHNSFKYLCIENNVDELWEQCYNHALLSRNETILIPEYTGYAEDALGEFLMELYNNDEERFIEISKKILVDFVEWSEETVNFSNVKDELLKLGYSFQEVEEIFNVVKKKTLDVTNKHKISELKDDNEQVVEKLCFVLMPFDEKFYPIYEKIKEVVEELGLICKRADEIFNTKPVIEDICHSIQKSRILIADLTGRNPNVFYELGFAHAKNKKVILITQDINDVPFDVKHYRCIVYKDTISGADELSDGLKKTLINELGEK
jgi:hypothetical protein